MQSELRIVASVLCGAFILLMSPTAAAQQSDAYICERPIEHVERFSASAVAEINAHDDLLVMLDRDDDGFPEEALHAAVQGGLGASALVETIKGMNGPTTIELIFRNNVAPSGFSIVIDEQEQQSLRVHNGTPDCYPEESADAWLRGLAHYKLSNFTPLASWTLSGLRNRPLIRRP